MDRDNRNRDRARDEQAKVLDVFLEYKNSFSDKELIQAIGKDFYTLLELVPKDDAAVKPGDVVYIGSGKRDDILFIKRQIQFDQLKEDAKLELIFALTDIVKEKENLFVSFFNRAGPISIRRHAFELIPGVGKKYLSKLLLIRDEGNFESYEDIEKRVPFLQNIVKILSERLLEEVDGSADMKMLSVWK